MAVGLSQVEIWKFKTPELNLHQSSTDFIFAIFYNNLDSGEWFWDNNFGQDYTLSKTELAIIEYRRDAYDHRMNPDSAVEEKSLTEEQTFRSENNGFLPLRGHSCQCRA